MNTFDFEFEIDDLLKEMVEENRINFAPHFICERLGLTDSKEVADYLLTLVPKFLTASFEIECPEGDSDLVVSDPREIIKMREPIYCHHCGVEYIPDPSRIWLTFNFSDGFKSRVKKKKKVEVQARPLLGVQQLALG